MNSSIQRMTEEAHEIIVNARQALTNEDITEDQFNEVILSTRRHD